MNFNFLSLFQRLLPNARAWRLTIDKTLRKFFQGLTRLLSDYVNFNDLVWLDILPSSTRELDLWEKQFALPVIVGMTIAERRTRLDGEWKALGGQTARYIQATLQNAGFPVFVHEWWVPGTEPAPGVKLCVTPRDPFVVLRPDNLTVVGLFDVQCGEALALCGEPDALLGSGVAPRGYPLVNKIDRSNDDLRVLCDEPLALCGEPDALCGEFVNFVFTPVKYEIPTDTAKWPYFLYIGGETFGDIITIPPNRKDEFETLALKICPCQQWLGILVEYGAG